MTTALHIQYHIIVTDWMLFWNNMILRKHTKEKNLLTNPTPFPSFLPKVAIHGDSSSSRIANKHFNGEFIPPLLGVSLEMWHELLHFMASNHLCCLVMTLELSLHRHECREILPVLFNIYKIIAVLEKEGHISCLSCDSFSLAVDHYP